MKWQVGDTCYFVENNRTIREARVVSIYGSFLQIKYGTNAGLRLRANRVFHTEEEAKNSVTKQFKSPYL